MATLGSPLYCGVHGEKGLLVGVVDVGGGVAFPPLDCLHNEVRPLDGILTALLDVVDVVGVATAVEGVFTFHMAAKEAIDGATNGE